MSANAVLAGIVEEKTTGADAVGSAPVSTSYLPCFAYIARHYGDERTVHSWRQSMPAGLASTPADVVLRAAEGAGYSAAVVRRELSEVKDYFLPCMVLTQDGKACVWLRRLEDDRVEVAYPEGDALIPVQIPFADLAGEANGYLILIKPPLKHDARTELKAHADPQAWFWGTLWRFRSYYFNVVVAAILVNVLTLAGVFFTMNAYDRVVPNQAYTTLWALAVGVSIAMIFELIGRQLRVYLVDHAGKKTDLILGSILFRQVLDVRLEKRPGSSGAFANLFREYESLRDFVSSATIAALTDVPFVLLFVAVISMIGGRLAWVLVLAIPIVIFIGYHIQKPLAQYMKENMRESALRHGLLVESLEGIETLKAVNGHGYVQKRWEDWSALSAVSAMKSKLLSSWALNWVSFVQQIVTVIIVVWGCYLIPEGLLSMGALIGVVILAGRAIGPMAQVVGLGVRYQQAKVSLEILNGLMTSETDRVREVNYLPRRRMEGGLTLQDASFTYPNEQLPALSKLNLNIQPGERIAILGRIGSGKSTLLRLLNGLYLPTDGSVLADRIDLRQIDPADVRHNIGLVTQECKLFFGTLRENVLMGAPNATPEQFIRVAKLTGLDAIAARHPKGFEMEIGENGRGLSGGQQQLVALARILISDSPVLLMDEPTSSMDGQTENAFIQQLQTVIANRTLIIATHRFSLLPMIDRIIVLDNGKVVADGPKDKIMAALTGGQISVPKS